MLRATTNDSYSNVNTNGWFAIKIIGNLMALCAIVVVFTQLHLPFKSLFIGALQNTGHGLVFALASWFANHSIGAPQAGGINWYRTWVLCSILFGLGLFIELVQHLSGRGASFSDVVMNSVGIFAGLAVFLSYAKSPSSRLARGWLILATMALGWCVQKPAWYLLADLSAKPLPVLMDFEPWASSALIRSSDADTVIAKHSDVWKGNRSQSVRVTFKPGRWPSIRFLEPAKNWRDYTAFSVRVYNPAQKPVPMRIRVDEAPIDSSGRLTMTVSRMVPAGESTLNVPFSELAINASVKGGAQFNEIARFVFFLPGSKSEAVLYFDDVSLL